MSVKPFVEIPGVPPMDIDLFLNARNFAYFQKMVDISRRRECSFCDFDEGLNVVLANQGAWRIWTCPAQFMANDVAEQYLLATKKPKNGEEHHTNAGSLTSGEIDDCVSLLCGQILPRFSGPTYKVSFEGHPVCNYGVYAEVIVPDRTKRIEAIFSNNMGTATSEMRPGKMTHKIGRWRCESYFGVGNGIGDRHIIRASKGYFNPTRFGEMALTDFIDIFSLFCWLGAEGCGNIPGSTLLMGLPGATLTMRSGLREYTAASRDHLHANVKSGKNGTVSETLAKNPADIAKKELVVAVWAKMLNLIETYPGMSEATAAGHLPSPEDVQIYEENKKK